MTRKRLLLSWKWASPAAELELLFGLNRLAALVTLGVTCGDRRILSDCVLHKLATVSQSAGSKASFGAGGSDGPEPERLQKRVLALSTCSCCYSKPLHRTPAEA